MLKHLSYRHITHAQYYHLGDIINIVQQVHHRSLVEPYLFCMFGINRCPCCGVNTAEMMQKVIDLLDTKVTFSRRRTARYEYATPKWVLGHARSQYDDMPYAKAKYLPKKRGNHVVCQFDARSPGDKIPPWNTINKIVNSKMINIGDSKMPCINKTELDLISKFHIIASAKHYIGIDSGLTHLALMTNTPIVLVHPRSWKAKNFYPDTKQIEYKPI